jgi:hypothetical protein
MLDDIARLEEDIFRTTCHFGFLRERNSRAIAKCLNSSSWASSMIAFASGLRSSDMRCSYQPIASASSCSDAAIRPKVLIS